MKIFRRGPGPRVKKNVLPLVLLFPLLIGAVFSSSGCAGVVSGGGGSSPQRKQALVVISIALPGGTPQSAYSTTLAATGGTGPYSWSVTKGSLPAGLTISSSGMISGTPTQAGTSAFTVQATDSSSPAATASANLSITVTAAAPSPSITTTSLPNATTGTAYSATLQASGGTTPYNWSVSVGTLPAGLTLAASTGVISGTATTAGTVSFTVQATDAASNTATKALSIAVSAAQSPSVTTTSLPAGTTGTIYSTPLQASGGTTPYSWSLSAGTLPAGLSLVASTGVISGTPTATGTASFTVQVTDAANNTGTKALSISVAAAGQPPSVTTTSLPAGTTDTAYSTTLHATGGTTPYSWSVSVGALPPGLTLVSSTGAISGAPTTAGTFPFTVKAQDAANNTGTKALSIVVAAQLPTVTTTSLPGASTGTAYSTTLQASEGTTPYSWSITAGALPAGLSLTAPTGVISGTPTTAGTVSFTVQVRDAANSTATKALSILVATTAQPPLVTTTSLPAGTSGTAYSTTVQASGGTAPYSWTVSAGGLPAGLSLGASTGVISGTPTTAGSASFTVQVKDSLNKTATKALSITVAAAPQPPSVTTTSLSGGTTGAAYSATLQASSGTTPYSWSLSAGTLPAGLSLVSSTGVISGTPTTAGTVSFTVMVTDAANNTATKALSIAVAAAPQPPTITTSSLPGGTTGTAYSTTLQASSGTTPYTWSFSAGTLPAGLSLVSSTGLISGTPTTAGTVSITVKVTDAANNTATKALSIAVAAAPQPPTITTSSLPGGTTGTAYSTTLQASSGTTPYTWSLSAGTLPAGLSLVSSTGVISGMPTTAGTVSITVKVTDAANNTATKALSIAVAAAPQPPTITTSSLPGGTTGTAYSTTLQASSGTTPYTWSLSAGTLPAGLSLVSSTGVISGMPTTAGTVSITVKVTDAANNTATKALSIAVAAAPQPPTITTSSLPGGTTGTAYSTTLQASSGTTPYTWSLSAGTLPAGLSLVSSTGVISGTPTTAGTVSITVKVTDAANNTATKALSIAVAAAPQPPTITTSSLPGGTTGTAYSTTLQASSGITPYTWSLSAGTLPAGLSLVSSTGVISGTPTTAGTVSITVKVTDAANNTATKALSIAVSAAPQPPTITTSSLPGGTTGTAYSTTLQASSGTTPYTWSLSAGTLPAGLSLVSSTGVISGTPTTAGTVSITVKVTDAANNTATKALSIAVSAAPQPPTITTSSLPGGTTGTAYSTTLQASSGTTPYTWSLSAGTLPAGLSLVSSTGVISGTPTAAGTLSFTVQVKDAANNTATKALSIAVAAAAQPPTVTTSSLPGGTVGTAYSTTLQASGGTTPYSWSISAGSLPAGLTLSSSTGQISGTPTAAGTASFTVQVTDAANNTGTKALSVGVTAAASLQITTTSLADGQVNSAYSASLAATGGTKPYAWSVSSGSLPAGLTLGSSTGQILGTPTASGSFSFAISVKDSSGVQQSATQFFAILVSAAVAGTPINSCQTLGNTGTTYTLESDVSAAGTCFTVSANNVTLDLNGHTVTYNTASQSSAVHAIAVTNGNSQGFTVYNGSLTEGTGSSASGSHVIDMGVVMSGPTVHDVTFTWKADYSQAINTNYGNSRVAGGSLIYNNTLNNNTAASCNQVGCRDMLQSASIRISNATATSTPAQMYGNTINGGPQGAIECDAPGCVIHDNNINPGNASVSESNDFAIWCWASCDVYNNTISTPLTAGSQGRGIQISAVETSTNGANVHNNTVTVIEKSNNHEYGGCSLGGAYALQFDDQPTGGTAQNNSFNAVADQCTGTGLRLTHTLTATNISKSNQYSAIRKSASSSACSFIGGDATTACAYAVALDSPTGFTSQNDSFKGDSTVFYFDWDGASGVSFISPTVQKGTTNPSPNFHTFVFRNGGTPVSNIHFQDVTFGSGTGPTDTDLPARGGNTQAVSVYIDWSQTITVTKSSGGAASGATVTFTDALGNHYVGTTNSSGVVVQAVPQYRLNNDSGANGVENHNPYTRTVSMPGCSTDTGSGLYLSAPGSASVTLGGC